MKTSILKRIQALGGNIDAVNDNSLQEDLLSMSFDTVLYRKPEDTAWAKGEEQEPIAGLGEFWDKKEALLETDQQAFIDKIIARYYCMTEEGYGQWFWRPALFTPFKEGTDDFAEWNEDFIDEEFVDLKEIIALTNNHKPDFVQLFFGYTYPDSYYICLSDPNPDNPTVFGTDAAMLFAEVSNAGSLETLLDSFMTKEELTQIIKTQLKD